MSFLTQGREVTYREAGVDITAGNQAVDLIKQRVKATWRPEVLTEIGGFGGLFALNPGQYREPVLVSEREPEQEPVREERESVAVRNKPVRFSCSSCPG